MNVGLLQSAAWQKLQDDLGEKSFLETGKDFHFLAIEKTTPFGPYLYLPYGPIYAEKSGFFAAVNALNELAERESAIFIRIEPKDPNFSTYLPKNAKKTKDLNPKETWVLDLSGENYREKMPSRLLRYYKNAEKNGLTIETSKNPDDVKYLLKLQKSLAKKKGISTFSEEYLKTELRQPFATLYLLKSAENPAEPLAAGLVFDDETTRYNLQGAQSDAGRKLHATGILTIRLIEDAKKAGKTTFDFWGIAPENAPKDHPWAGFTSFKKTFAGEEKVYAGTYDLKIKPLKYRLYLIFRAINRLIRRIK